jgi:raffinose/stachyose/melibiose transport system permease protein
MSDKVNVKHKINITPGRSAVYIFLVFWTIIQIFPLYWLVTFSLKSNAEIFGGNIIGLPSEWHWENYLKVFTQAHIYRYMLNSLLVAGMTIFLTSLLASMASYAIVRLKWKLSGTVNILFLIGMMLSIQAVLLPLYVNLKPIRDTLWSLIIPYAAFSLPMAILLISGTLKTIPKEMEEAAFIDGANIYRIFFQIILPLLKPILSTVAILNFLDSWNELMFAQTFINSDQWMTITVGVNNMIGRYSTKWGLIGAGLTVATVPTLILYVFLSKNIQESLAMGAVKG